MPKKPPQPKPDDLRTLDISLAEKLFGMSVVGEGAADRCEGDWCVHLGEPSPGFSVMQPLYLRECICGLHEDPETTPEQRAAEREDDLKSPLLAGHRSYCLEVVPHFSTDAAAMLTVVEKMLELDWSLSCIAKPDQDPSLKFACIALKLEPVKLLVKYAPTLPLAVARAADAALDSEGK